MPSMGSIRRIIRPVRSTTSFRCAPAEAATSRTCGSQPATNEWNGKNHAFHEKDDLEAWVCAQIKAGKLESREAFDRITTDWVKYYEEVKPGHQSEIVE